jgi:hypothetical protein
MVRKFIDFSNSILKERQGMTSVAVSPKIIGCSNRGFVQSGQSGFQALGFIHRIQPNT